MSKSERTPMRSPLRVTLLSCVLLGLASTMSGQSGSVTLTLTEGTNIAVALSPDGQRLAIDLQGTLWTLPISGGSAKALAPEWLDARQPTWSPDGQRIAFQGYRDGTWNIWAISADGDDARPLTWGPFDDREPAWSPDGARIAFSSDRTGNYDVWELILQTGDLRQITTGASNEYTPAYSPDGSQIAFVSDRRDEPGVWALQTAPIGAPASGSAPMERMITTLQGAVSAPSWSPDGRHLVVNVIANNQSRLLLDGQPITANEDVFPFRVQWVSPTEIVYTSDGKIRRRTLGADQPQTISFTAALSFPRTSFVPRMRNFPISGPQEAVGIMGPVISPDGQQIAFSALGDVWLMKIGARPERLTNDSFVDMEPTWSPDGASIAFASDRAGTMDIWVRDLRRSADRRLTELPGAETTPVWSPDGRRVSFLSDGEVYIVEIASGDGEKVHDRLFDPGRPSWSPDGKALVLSALVPYSTRYREGTNQVLRIGLDTRSDASFIPLPHRSVGGRENYGPVWSPDGTLMAAVMDGVLSLFPVGKDGSPLGPPRRVSRDLASSPSWTSDSRQLLYQTTDRLKIVSVDDGRVREVATNLMWSPKVITGRHVVHAGRLFDGRTSTLRENIDIVIDGNRIKAVEPHRADLHSGTVIDASNETVMPGLIEMHAHLAKSYGEALGRIWLAYGVTSVRNPAANPFEGLEDREAIESGVRIGPRVFTTGGPFDGIRVFYAGGVATDGGGQLDLELERTKRLGFDLVKTYVRLPDLVQKRVIEYAHQNGMPVTSHEIYPAVAYGADGVEHIRGTSRRGYSPKSSQLNRSYRDVIDLLAASKMTITPTINLQGGFALWSQRDPSWLDDARVRTLFPASVSATHRAALERDRTADWAARAAQFKPLGETVLAITTAGGRVIAGTDAPFNPFAVSLHSELESYVDAGLTPFQALQTAMSTAADALGMGTQLGAVEAGKLADLAFVEGNPLADIRDARKIRRVIKDGEVFELESLLQRPTYRRASSVF